MISVAAICTILGLIALLLALSGRLTAAVVLALVAFVLFLANAGGYV